MGKMCLEQVMGCRKREKGVRRVQVVGAKRCLGGKIMGKIIRRVQGVGKIHTQAINRGYIEGNETGSGEMIERGQGVRGKR